MGIIPAIALIVLALGSSYPVQNRPDFSGSWSIVPSRSVWHDGDIPVNITVFGDGFSVEHTGDRLTIAIENEKPFTWTYRLDGLPARNAPPGPKGPQETTSTVEWSGSRLIITTRRLVERDGTSKVEETTTRAMSFNADGTLLVEAPWGHDRALIGSVYSKRQ